MIWKVLEGPGGEILSSKRQPKVDGVYVGEPEDWTRDRHGDSKFGHGRYTRDDIWNADGTFKTGFSQRRKSNGEKPRIGLDKIDDAGRLVAKSAAEVEAMNKEDEATTAEARLDSQPNRMLLMAEAWEGWKARTGRDTGFRTWLRAKLRGGDPA
jgi:hypothetical protein